MLTPQFIDDLKKTELQSNFRPETKRQERPPVAPEEEAAPRVNILLVDDTPENLVALEAVLADLDQNLVKARSGEEALRLLLKQEFAVILLDVNMPGLSGFETAELIRQRKSSEHIPIIFVSAISTSDTHLFQGYSLGAVDYIFTPVIPDVLRSKVTVFVELLKKTEQAKIQAEKLRQLEEREHQARMLEASQRIEIQTKQNRFFTLSVDLLAIADFDGHLKELNPAWHKLLGYSEETLKGNPFWEWMDPEEKSATTRFLHQAVKEQRAINFEACYRCKDGTMRMFAWTIAPYGAEELLYLFGRDITERRKAEEEVKKLNQTLKQRASQLEMTNSELKNEVVVRKQAEQALHDSNSALEAFSFSVSHDLRAPIRAMHGFARVLLEDYGSVLDELGRDCATRIVNASERMDNLVQDLLIFSRLGHTTLELTGVSIAEVVREAMSQLESELKARHALVEVIEPLPRVLAHSVTLAQILMNLIANGTKFVAKGVQPRVKVWAESDEESVCIWVEDNGIGIPPEDQEKVFRVFERLHSADSYPGTGLGLAIVRKGVERMGGQAGLESEIGKGSRFWIRLQSSPLAALV